MRVEGSVGEKGCWMTIDTGAQKTVLHADMVKPEEYTGDSIRLLEFYGGAVTVPLAKVWFHIGDYVFKHEVAVCRNSPEQALLGLDIGILDYLMQLEKEQREQREASKLSVNVTTRAQTKARQEQEREDADLSARDQAHPAPIELEPESVTEVEQGRESEELVEEELEVEVAGDQPEVAEGEDMAGPVELETVAESSPYLP